MGALRPKPVKDDKSMLVPSGAKQGIVSRLLTTLGLKKRPQPTPAPPGNAAAEDEDAEAGNNRGKGDKPNDNKEEEEEENKKASIFDRCRQKKVGVEDDDNPKENKAEEKKKDPSMLSRCFDAAPGLKGFVNSRKFEKAQALATAQAKKELKDSYLSKSERHMLRIGEFVRSCTDHQQKRRKRSKHFC